MHACTYVYTQTMYITPHNNDGNTLIHTVYTVSTQTYTYSIQGFLQTRFPVASAAHSHHEGQCKDPPAVVLVQWPCVSGTAPIL